MDGIREAAPTVRLRGVLNETVPDQDVLWRGEAPAWRLVGYLWVCYPDSKSAYMRFNYGSGWGEAMTSKPLPGRTVLERSSATAALLFESLLQDEINWMKEFWKPKIALAMSDDPKAVRINGVHYFVGDKNNAPRSFKGYGGAKWKIKFHDGREVETDNLWHNGTIPPALREFMPDNAEFVTQ